MASKTGSDNDLLPEDSAGEAADFDVSDLRVDFSDAEAKSEGRSFDPLPTGKYNVVITDWSMEKSGPNAKHPGKPYWHLELTVQDGTYENRKLWTNVMLFSGALYSLSQLLKVMGREDVLDKQSPNYGKIPSCDEFVGKPFVAVVKKQRDTYAEKQEEDKSVRLFKNEVKGMMPSGTAVGSVSSGSDSLLPG
jgi:hypothetical protein